MPRTILTLLLAGFAVSAAAQMSPAAPPPEPIRDGIFLRADSNGDGVVTRGEAVAKVEARFHRMDANRDGKLDWQEMAVMRGPDGQRPPGPQQ